MPRTVFDLHWAFRKNERKETRLIRRKGASKLTGKKIERLVGRRERRKVGRDDNNNHQNRLMVGKLIS